MNQRSFTILIVSPDRKTLRRLSKFLDVFGYHVRQARDAAQALAAAETAPPDFLIVDGTFANATGASLSRELRQSGLAQQLYSLLLIDQPDVAQLTAALEQGFDDFLAAPVVFGELLARLRAGARALEFERRLGEQAPCDPVTGLASQSALIAELERRSARGKGQIGWLALFDLDYFHRFTARQPRQDAQTLLRQVAQRLSGRCGSDDFAAALGADRIGIVLAPDGEAAVVSFAEEALAALAEAPFELGGLPCQLTASCGLSPIASGEKLEPILARLQRAVALAKASGRNCVVTTGEVDRDAEEWTQFAADGKLFETTLARHVMQPCPLLLQLDETVEHAHASLALTGLTQAAVVDQEGKLAGIVTLDQLAGRLRPSKPKPGTPAGTSSVRLVRHVMNAEVSRFEDHTSLAELMEFFTLDSESLAVVVKNKRPLGFVHCQGLAALNERLTADRFTNLQPRTGTSSDLLVPELALAD